MSNVYGKVTIQTPKGEQQFWVIKDGNKIAGLKCSCTGNTKQTATQMIYNHQTEQVECPHCKKQPEVIETCKQYNQKIEEEIQAIRDAHPLQINKTVFDFSTGIQYYSLSKRIPEEDWEKVAHLFTYMEKTNFEDAYNPESGWYTREPEKVEKILGITNTTSKEDKERKEKAQQEKERKKQLQKVVEEAFQQNTYITPHTLEEVLQTGDAYTPPDDNWREKSIYGLGRMYIITPENIIKIQNNGHDGADWMLNNIQTGGAGAIGTSIPYNKEIAEIIKAHCTKF